MRNSKKSMKERIKVLSDEKQRHRGLKQALCRKTKIDKALRIKIRNLKKEMVSKDATIQSVKHKCHCSSQAEKSKLLTHSKVAMKSRHKSSKLLYKVDKCKMMIQNAMLRKEIKDLKAKIDALELEQNRLQTIDQKCVSTKSDATKYSTACQKVVYTCLEYQVPLTSIGPVVTAAMQELGGQIIDHLPDPSSISYFTYELGIISDLQVGEIIYTNDNILLSWDFTTVDGNHINETHITIPGTSPTHMC